MSFGKHLLFVAVKYHTPFHVYQMPTTIQFYHLTCNSILQSDYPVHLSPLTSFTHFL